jgi:hypothetical protein
MFAKRAKRIRTNAHKNEILDDAHMVKKYKKEMELLRAENTKLKVISLYGCTENHENSSFDILLEC